MKKVILLLALFVSVTHAWGKSSDSVNVKAAILTLDNALVAKDSNTIRSLLHPAVSYGHSNGWIEYKSDVTNDLTSGKLTYKSIKSENMVCVQSGKTMSVRFTTNVDVEMGGKPLTFTLKVLQVWVKQKGHWVLLSRQSVKV